MLPNLPLSEGERRAVARLCGAIISAGTDPADIRLSWLQDADPDVIVRRRIGILRSQVSIQ